jgi:ParB family chromosome partitioning protein
MPKIRLGKGLGSLIPAMDISTEEPVTHVFIEELRPNPFQPRRTFDQDKIRELADSIRQHGVIQPIIVRRSLVGYEIVAGERRWRASQLAGLDKVPVVVRELNDTELREIALIENLQREDLNPIEIAEAYLALMKECNLTQEALAEKVGQSRSHVANFLRLLHLPEEVRDYVSRGTLSMGHARALLGIENPDMQKALAKKIIEDDLNVRAVEQMVSRLANPVSRGTMRRKTYPEYNAYEERFREHLGTGVKIIPGKKRGRIEIEFYSTEDLERLLSLIVRQPKID